MPPPPALPTTVDIQSNQQQQQQQQQQHHSGYAFLVQFGDIPSLFNILSDKGTSGSNQKRIRGPF
jgi:hypothetical protein